MYINWFICIIIFDDRICYIKELGVMIIIQFYQRNSKLMLPWQKQVNQPVITIYAEGYSSKYMANNTIKKMLDKNESTL